MPARFLRIFTLLAMFLFAQARGGDVREPELSREEVARIFMRSLQWRDRLLSDYRKTIEVYYELKKKSGHPDVFPNVDYDPAKAELFKGVLRPEDLKRYTQKTVSRVGEFNFALYREFQKEIDADPRLRGNLFMKKLREYNRGERNYGHAAANDILQRVSSYVFDEFPISNRENLSNSAIYALEGVMGDAAKDASDSATIEGKVLFFDLSRKFGYPKNHATMDEIRRVAVSEALKIKMETYRHELQKFGYVLPHAMTVREKEARAATTGAFGNLTATVKKKAACPIAFSSLLRSTEPSDH